MRDDLGWVLFVGAVIVIAIIANQNKNSTTPPTTLSQDKDDEVKCELRDAYGRLITITGHPSDPQFVRMCQSQTNQQVYVYGYPYTFIRYWTPRHWGPRPGPMPGPHPAPPAA